ncbi:hypothetical protein PtB15_7B678 [Puccinia triticina]|nr:hypothetical protein PtB15_7B678 [Puccinia triticina]
MPSSDRNPACHFSSLPSGLRRTIWTPIPSLRAQMHDAAARNSFSPEAGLLFNTPDLDAGARLKIGVLLRDRGSCDSEGEQSAVSGTNQETYKR